MLALYQHFVGTVCRDVQRNVESRILKVSRIFWGVFFGLLWPVISSNHSAQCVLFVSVTFPAGTSAHRTVLLLRGHKGDGAALKRGGDSSPEWPLHRS